MLQNFITQTLALANRLGQLLKDMRTEVDTNTSDIATINTELPTLAKADDVYTKEETDTEINNKLSGVYKYKGSVTTRAELPTSAETGHVYNVKDTGMNWAKLSTSTGGELNDGWDALGEIIDLSDYATEEWANGRFEREFVKKTGFNFDVASTAQSKSGTSDTVTATPKTITTYIDDKIGTADPLQEFNDALS